MRILIVEDDRGLARSIEVMLEKAGYVCDKVYDGDTATVKAKSHEYDLIILDLGLPQKDGMEVCKELRGEGKSVPILMLTGRTELQNKISGLESGADDYLVKPFETGELLARIRALLRRPKPSIPDKIKIGDLELDNLSCKVKRQGKNIDLMPKEFNLLQHLMRKGGEVASKDELLNHVWGIYSRTSSNRLEVYIRYLRRKIDDPFKKPLIKTIRGRGYKIEA